MEFVLFPSGPNRRLHPLIENMMSNSDVGAIRPLVVAQPVLHRFGIVLYVVDLFLRNRLRGRMLRSEIRAGGFSAVHALELQHAGYLLLSAADHLSDIPVLVTNWGSDIFWFRRFASHRKRLERLMEIADFYSCECRRDIGLATDLGFSGHVLPVIPNAGGLEIPNPDEDQAPPSERSILLIKGYTAFVGRALRPLRALRALKEELEPFQVVVYSASRTARAYSWMLRRFHGIDVQALPPGVSHNEMLKLFSEARVYVGISLSDGISTSLLEAMSMGTFPIQTNTSCADEWLMEDSGFLVDPDDQSGLVTKLRRALTDDELVNNAARINHRTISERASRADVSRVAKSFYVKLLSNQNLEK